MQRARIQVLTLQVDLSCNTRYGIPHINAKALCTGLIQGPQLLVMCF